VLESEQEKKSIQARLGTFMSLLLKNSKRKILASDPTEDRGQTGKETGRKTWIYILGIGAKN